MSDRTKFALVVDGVAVNVIDGDPTEFFHGDVASQLVEVPLYVEVGAQQIDGVWRNPEPTEPVQEVLEPMPLLTPMTLYMAFKPAERIAIKTSSDPLVQEFWAMYQLSVQLQKPTDPNLPSVREAIGYLAAPVEPGPGAGILAGAERIGEILAGIPQ